MSKPPFIRRRERPSQPAAAGAAAPEPASPVETTEDVSNDKVGYKSPPRDTRFGGPRGNRPGRKKGSKSRETILREELDAKIDVPGSGKMSKFQVAARQLANQAAKGDLKAIMAMLKLAFDRDRQERAHDEQTVDPPLTEHDQSVFELIMAMAKEAVAANANAKTPEAGGDHA